MKNRMLTIVVASVMMVSMATAADNTGQNIEARQYIITRSNNCVKKVRELEHKRNPDKFPTFDAYVTSWRAKLFSNDNDSVRIPKFKLKGDPQDIEVYKKCMGE